MDADYNYTRFVISEISHLLRFDQSPPVGAPAPDFPLWHLDGAPTSLKEIWSSNMYTVVEFGSFS
jgi:hypothetical protein